MSVRPDSVRRAASRWLVGAALLLALLSTGRASAATLEVVPLDRAAAARVPIDGATPGERAAALQALAAVVRDLPVRRVVFFGPPTQRVVGIGLTWPTGRDAERVGEHRRWLGDLLGLAIARRQTGTAQPIRRVELHPPRERIEVERDRRLSRDAQQVAALGQAALDRAVAAGWDDTSVRVWQLGPGALSVRVRLTELQYLTGPNGWGERLLGEQLGFRYDAEYEIEAPNGQRLADGRNYGCCVAQEGYGGVAYDPAASPPTLAGPTRLEIGLTLFDEQGRRSTRGFVLDCEGGASVGVPDPEVTCAELVARRYALLGPIVSNECAAAGPDAARLTGMFLGVAIARDYTGCSNETNVWQELLGLPGPAYIDRRVDPEAAARVRIDGATPAERRAMRRALEHVPASIRLGRLVFDSQGGRRGLVLPARYYDDADRYPFLMLGRWIATAVAEDLARRMRSAGLPVSWLALGRRGDTLAFSTERVERRSAAATAALTRALRQRAIDAGFVVRGASGWPTGPGAVTLTIRLREREFLAGPTDWMARLMPDRLDPQRGYAGLLVVEAPDGTTVFVQGNPSRTADLLLRGGGEHEVGTAPPPFGLTGPTRLELTSVRQTASGAETVQAVLDCSGGASAGVGNPAAACTGLIADRYALLAPVPADLTCESLVPDDVTVTGTLGGVQVTRHYTACDGGLTGRWRALLALTG